MDFRVSIVNIVDLGITINISVSLSIISNILNFDTLEFLLIFSVN